MKLKLLTLLIFVCSYTFGQTYKSIVVEASRLYSNKEYQKSVEKYKEAFQIERKDENDLYNAGCSASLLGDEKLALEWLNLALQNGWTNIRHLKADADLTLLHNNMEWEKLLATMQKEVDKKEANYNKQLQTKLLDIYDDDQVIRKQFISAQNRYGYQSRQVDSLTVVMLCKDSVNLIKITGILDQYGWVGADDVGDQGNKTLFLVIQHADLKVQQKYLPMLRDAVKNKKAKGTELALLEDRIALGEGRRQIYGSQVGRDTNTNKYYIFPLDDPNNVDKRRQSVGLGFLADYVKRWGIDWNVEEYKKQLPELEEKLKHR